MTALRALIIDDEPDILELLALTLERMDIASDSAQNVQQAIELLSANHYNLCLTDMKLPDGNGIDLVKHIQSHCPTTPVAVITAHGNMDTAIHAMKAGAFDFLSKPVDISALRKLVSAAVKSSQIPMDNTQASTRIIGSSEAIQKLSKSIQKLARSQAPIYISGESGSGKELVAKSIHELGPRAKQAFVAVNCGAIPRELMESEFFGHKKGSFTGAHQDKRGLFQTADGGTLFLDEVADLPLEMQVKLLRAIQEKAVRPIGSANEVNIDVRILCATHKNLGEQVDQGNFRQDLFYRLNVIEVPVPPLRERSEDIPLLALHILSKLASDMSLAQPTIHKEAMSALKNYTFPGNVRELENILERASTLCDSETIQVDDLQLSSTAKSTSATGGDSDYASRCAEYPSLDAYLEDVEKEILCHALEQVKWNKTLAAKQLGISFRSLRYRLQKLNLDTD